MKNQLDKKKPLILEGEWVCYEQEGGYCCPMVVVGEEEIGEKVDEWLGLSREAGRSDVNIRVTIEVISTEQSNP